MEYEPSCSTRVAKAPLSSVLTPVHIGPEISTNEFGTGVLPSVPVTVPDIFGAPKRSP